MSDKEKKMVNHIKKILNTNDCYFRIQLEQYLASFEFNIVYNNPAIIKKNLIEFYPEIILFFTKLEEYYD